MRPGVILAHSRWTCSSWSGHSRQFEQATTAKENDGDLVRTHQCQCASKNLSELTERTKCITDSTRVLRMPGFANRKFPEEFIVQARQESDAVYRLHDFTIDEDSPEAPRHVGEYRQRERSVIISGRQRRKPECLSRTVRGSDFTIFAIHSATGW
jgi:hypothetical protein